MDLLVKGERLVVPGRIVANISAGIDDPMRFGNKLRLARIEKGYSQLELAALTGYSNGWISGVERGSSVPTTTFARRMELALGADLGVNESLGNWLGKRSGSVGDDKMTATEVAGYAGLSRTRIYALMRNYVGKGEFDPISWRTMIPWEDVDGYRRIKIIDCATWVINDRIASGDIDFGSLEGTENRPGAADLIKVEELAIKEWLKRRRSSL